MLCLAACQWCECVHHCVRFGPCSPFVVACCCGSSRAPIAEIVRGVAARRAFQARRWLWTLRLSGLDSRRLAGVSTCRGAPITCCESVGSNNHRGDGDRGLDCVRTDHSRHLRWRLPRFFLLLALCCRNHRINTHTHSSVTWSDHREVE